MTKAIAEKNFRYIYEALKDKDIHQLREAWNLYTDSLCKNGDITQKQYDTWLYPSYFKK